MKYCKKCGKELPDWANFCDMCGTPMSKESEAELDRKLKETQYENEKTKSGCSTMMIVGICGLGLCVTATPFVGIPVIILGVIVGIYAMNKK